MNITGKIAHQTQAVMGSVKRIVGRVTGSRRPRTEGRAGQAKGNV